MQIGVRLGAYEVIAKIGEGGMGEVYRARDTKLGAGRRREARITIERRHSRESVFRQRPTPARDAARSARRGTDRDP
jgi:serine/threonine protein kinase